MLSGKSSLRNYYIFYTYHSIFSAIFIFVYFIHFFFFFYLFIRHIDIYMFPMITFLKNLTRARMEDWGAILTDSGRQWGTDGTEAISPWWSFNGDTLGSARTYYGS